MYFWIYGLRKTWLDKYLKKSSFTGPFDKQHGKRVEILFKAQRQHLHHIYWTLWRQLGLKNSLWEICKILGLFVNLLTVNDKYSLLNSSNLFQHFHMQVSQNWKTFSEFFLEFTKFRSNYEHFRKNDYPPTSFIFELTDSQKRG